MAIPYPYNRLGINAGGTITPIEPIEGSQGVFIYNSYGSVVSSAMQVVNKNLAVESARVWSKGMLINPKINNRQNAVIFTSGTALNVSLIDSAALVVSGGYVKNVEVPINTNRDLPYSNRISVIGGVVSDVNFHGDRAYVYLNSGGEVHNLNYTVIYNSLNIYSAKLFNMSVFNDSRYHSRHPYSGRLNINVYSGAYIDGVYRDQGYSLVRESNYINVSIPYDASDINLLNFNVGSLGNFVFDGVPSNVKLTGTYTGGSFWLSNNTFHNFYLNPDYGLTLAGSNSVSFDSFLLESGAYLYLDGTSCYYNGNNITKRHSARLDYPNTFNDTFTIGGITDEKGSFGYSNGSGSNIVFGGGGDLYRYSINLNSGFIIYPLFSSAHCYLSSGTFISLGFVSVDDSYYRGEVHLQNGGYILNNDPNSIGGRYIFEDFSYTTVSDSTLSSTWIYSPTWSRGMTNITIGVNDTILVYGSECDIHNLVQNSGAAITLNAQLRSPFSSVSNNVTTVYSDWRVIEGSNANGTFKLSNGTFINPAIYGGVKYSSNHIRVGKGGFVSGGVVYDVRPYNLYRSGAGIWVGNNGTVSGVTICSGGAVYADIASYGAAPSIIDVLQVSGGNIYPNGSYIVYDTQYYDTSSNGLDPVINGTNDYGSFYLTSGTLHNWAVYGSYNVGFDLSLYNFTNSLHALDTAHFIGSSAACVCSVRSYDADDSTNSFLTDININSLYLKDGALLSVYYYTNRISINDVYVENSAVINAGRQNPEAGLLTFNLLDYASLNSPVSNRLNGAGIMYYTSLVVNDNQNVDLYSASGDSLIVNSGGLVALEDNNSFISANIASGGYLQVYNIGLSYNNNISGNNERGLFMVSGSYASNLIWGAPPNRSQYVSLVVDCNSALLNDCVVTNNNVLRVEYISLANISVYNATLACYDSTNKITYMYIGNGGYVYCEYLNNASYLFVEEGSLFGTRSNTLNNITVNSNGACMFYYYNTVISAEVNSGGRFYLGGLFTITSNNDSIAYAGRYNNGSFINVQSGGTLHVGSACTAYRARVNLGGTIIVSSRGYAVGLISNGGASVIAMTGAHITYASQ